MKGGRFSCEGKWDLCNFSNSQSITRSVGLQFMVSVLQLEFVVNSPTFLYVDTTFV